MTRARDLADSADKDIAGTLEVDGLTVGGNIAVTGTVDGRDVATDGTKLDGIEAAATADQTNAEIRTAVEAASDSNVFTDADHSKLNGIEASADVTDSTNVASAGALMTSGGTITGDITVNDGVYAYFGTSNDGLKIHHSNNNSFIEDVGTGNFLITTNGNNIQLMKNQAEQMLVAKTDGSVELYHDNSKKLETASGGISVTGGGTFSSSSSGEFNALTISQANNSSGNESRIRFKRTTDAGSDREVAAIVADRVGGNDTALVFETNTDGSDGAVERVRITQDGNVSIGTSSALGKLHVHEGARNGGYAINGSRNGLVIEDSQHAGMSICGGAGNGGTASIAFPNGSSNIDGLISYNLDGRYFEFHVGGSERLRIMSDGRIAKGRTSAIAGADITHEYNSSNGPGLLIHSTDTSGNAHDQVHFRRNNSKVGSISTTSSGTTYNTTSDIRLKQDIEPLVATDKLMAMNPVSYNWKADPNGPRSMGFIAQEMQEIMPEAVSTGEDDMMSMDYGRITPILVSALQDAHRKIEQLEQRLTDLETGNE